MVTCSSVFSFVLRPGLKWKLSLRNSYMTSRSGLVLTSVASVSEFSKTHTPGEFALRRNVNALTNPLNT